MSMGIENMTADEVRVLQRVLLGVCGAVMGELAEACRLLAGADCGEEPETPEEVPEEPEEDGSDEGDEGDEGEEGDEKPRRYRGPAITDEEILDWAKKRDEGMPITEIARLVGRGISVVCRKLKEYDSAQLDAARDAEDAEDEEDEEGNEE